MKVTESHQNVSSRSALHLPLEFTHASNLICVVNTDTHTTPKSLSLLWHKANPGTDLKLFKIPSRWPRATAQNVNLGNSSVTVVSLRYQLSWLKSIMSLWSQPMQHHSFFINLLPFFLAPYLPTSINLRLINNQFIGSEIYHCHFLDVITLSAGCEGQSNCS